MPIGGMKRSGVIMQNKPQRRTLFRTAQDRRKALEQAENNGNTDTGKNTVAETDMPAPHKEGELNPFDMATIPISPEKRDKRIVAALIAGAGAAVAVIVLVFVSVLGEFSIDDHYIDEAQIPLAAPPIGDRRIFAHFERDMLADHGGSAVELYNPEGNNYWLVFELTSAITGEILYESEMMAPGERLTDVTLSRIPTEDKYEVILTIRAYEKDDNTEIYYTVVSFLLGMD